MVGASHREESCGSRGYTGGYHGGIGRDYNPSPRDSRHRSKFDEGEDNQNKYSQLMESFKKELRQSGPIDDDHF